MTFCNVKGRQGSWLCNRARLISNFVRCVTLKRHWSRWVIALVFAKWTVFSLERSNNFNAADLEINNVSLRWQNLMTDVSVTLRVPWWIAWHCKPAIKKSLEHFGIRPIIIVQIIRVLFENMVLLIKGEGQKLVKSKVTLSLYR